MTLLQSAVVALSILALHEVGHVVACDVVGLKVSRVGVNWIGIYIVHESGNPTQNILVAFAGPLANLLVAGFFMGIAPLFALMNLACGLINLLPIKHSDGSSIIREIRRGQRS